MKYKVVYPNINNAGDLLNIYICREIFGIEIESAGFLRADLVAIGSSLGGLQYSDNARRKIKERVFSNLKPIHVWGTGFMNYETENEQPLMNKKIIVHAVRGELSRVRMERMMEKSLDGITVCDGGILTSRLFDKQINKKYKVGIIPHYREMDLNIYEEMKKDIKGSVIIDLRDTPMEVYRKIAECEYVISSSLHGLIISDSFGIPNLHIKVSDLMLGDGFKYADYYSGYGIQNHQPWLIKEKGIPTIDVIQSNYCISEDVVREKQEVMIRCFPFTRG